MALDLHTQTAIEAAAFRRLVRHLRERSDVQNLDLMDLAGFCRNCLGNWMMEAAREAGADLSKDQSRQEIYGMSYEDWKAKYQTDAPGSLKPLFKPPHSH